jgi:hypothetical protein
MKSPTRHPATTGLPFAAAPSSRRGAVRRLEVRSYSYAPNSVRARVRTGFGTKVDRLVRRLEDSEFAHLYGLGHGKASRTDRNPANGVIGRRIVASGLPGLQAYGQIVQRGRHRKRTRHRAKLAEQYRSRSDLTNILWRLVDTFGWSQFVLWRQRYPKLESARSAGLSSTATMPRTVTGLEPFDPPA